MTIQQIYTQYNIMPSLAKHQYRVAAVAQYICEKTQEAVDTKEIVAACLLHDMGNIIKFNLELFPEFLVPEGMAYWDKVKKEYLEKYGSDEHRATIEIVKEIYSRYQYDMHETPPQPPSSDKRGKGELREMLQPKRVLELIDAIGFASAKNNYETRDFSRKIAAYADMRVEPHGVVSLKKRLAEGQKRFNINKPGKSTAAFFDEMAQYLEKIEMQLFEVSQVQAADITEDTVAIYLTGLKDFQIG